MHTGQPITVLGDHATADKRARIARELRDVIAHSMSVVAVQAAAADAYLDRDIGQSREHLGSVRRAACDAMGEMRRLAAVLCDETALLDPQPTLARVGELVDEARAAGVRLDLVHDGERRDVAPGLDLAAFRILEEAIANVCAHSAADSAAVRISYRPDAIHLQVRHPIAAGRAAPEAAAVIDGIRERARLYDGDVQARIDAEDCFDVRVRLPR